MDRHTPSGNAHAAVMMELASTGAVRIGVVYAPAVSTFFVTVDDVEVPRGVTVELGRALAGSLGSVPVFVAFPNSGELTAALEKADIDVAFLPVDEERRQRIAFGPAYFLLESTALVRSDTDVQAVGDLDRPGVRVAGIAGTTTIRRAEHVLASATVTPVTSVGEAMDQLLQGCVDAVVLSRDVLATYVALVPGSRILAGHLHVTGIAIAVPKGRPAALRFASRFLERAKASGVVRRAFDNFHLLADPVAAAEPLVSE